MASSDSAFVDLTGVNPEEFFDGDRRRRFSLHRTSLDNQVLVSPKDIDELLSNRALSYPFIRIVKNGKEVAPPKYLRKPVDAEFRLVDNDRVHSLYAEGSTVILQRVHLWNDALHRLTDGLQRALMCPVNCNIYLTPPNSKGFEPHFDTHDVFILQLFGEKAWSLYDLARPAPLEGDSLTRKESAEYLRKAPAKEVCLAKGDVLFIPRGFVHDAFTKDSHSGHVTFGIFPLRAVDIVRQLSDALGQREAFRFSAVDIEGASNLGQLSAAASSAIAEGFRDDNVAAVRRSKFVGVPTQQTNGRFLELVVPSEIDGDTIVVRRPDIVFELSSTDDKVALSFYSKRVVLPHFMRPSVLNLTSADFVKVGDLEGPIDLPSKILLAKRLIAEGFLTVRDKN